MPRIRHQTRIFQNFMLKSCMGLCNLSPFLGETPDALQVYIHMQSQARNSYHLGYFASEVEAAKAYDREILKVCMGKEKIIALKIDSLPTAHAWTNPDCNV